MKPFEIVKCWQTRKNGVVVIVIPKNIREKVARGLKKDDSILINGYQIFHNYIRPHMALDGKTPSEACGITIQGDDKWKTLIQRASL